MMRCQQAWVRAAGLGLVILLSVPGFAQTLLRPSRLSGSIQILNSDRAVLASGVRRDDLPCDLEPLGPHLGFDLQFQAGYRIRIPLSTLAGEQNHLRILLRIIPLDGSKDAHYFVDRYSVPSVDPGASGSAVLGGQYSLGPGRYEVNWLMRDGQERVCSHNWEIETPTYDSVEKLSYSRPAFSVGPRESEIFLEEPPVLRAAVQKLLHVKLMVNFTPTDPRDYELPPYDLKSIVSMLRAIAREPQIGRFSIVAFNLQEERVIFEQHDVPRIDFPRLGDAVENIEGGLVDVSQLQDENSGPRFLAELLSKHLGPQEPEPDAVVFLGPKVHIDNRVPKEMVEPLDPMSAPIFHLVYDRNPRTHPWRDAIGRVLKIHKALEYSITLPKDLGKAMTDMMFRLKSNGDAVSGAM